MTISWSHVFIAIRAVRGRREYCLERLLSHSIFKSGKASFGVCYHKVGRSVPESYCDALSAGLSHDWVLQVEDDAILRKDFESTAIRLLNDARNQVAMLSLYSGRRIKPGERVNHDSPSVEFLPGSRFLMAQAFFMRSDVVPSHNDFVLEFCKDRPYATDTATAHWLKSRKYKYARAWPSIVQHDDVPSLSGHNRNPNRFAESFSNGH